MRRDIELVIPHHSRRAVIARQVQGVAKRAMMCDGASMDIITCPQCGARDHLPKDGHNRPGTQRYRCRT